MATPESKVKNAVKKRLEYYGVLPFTHAADAPGGVEGIYWMPSQGAFAVHGPHDFCICWRGVYCTLETKAPENKVDATPSQAAYQIAVNKAGGISIVGVRSAAAVDELFRFVQERTK